MKNTKAPALDRFRDLTIRMSGLSDDPEIQAIVVEMSTLHNKLEDNYIYVRKDGDTPTVAQGITLARLARDFRFTQLRAAPGSGLPDGWVAFAIDHGLAKVQTLIGGIAPEGDAHT